MIRNRRSALPRLSMDRLEDRVTPSWGAMPPATVTPPASAVVVKLDGNGDAGAVGAAITSGEVDWYEFTAQPGTTVFSAATPSSNLDTVIGIYDAAGVRVGFNDDINYPKNTDSRATVTLTAGTYYFGVTNFSGPTRGAYNWSINGPSGDDEYENNDSLATASNLGTVTSSRTISSLILADPTDLYRFTTTSTGTSASNVSISFNNAQGNLTLRLINAAGAVVATSATSGNVETVSLAGQPAGTYIVQVYGELNPSYSLTITPPALPPSPPPPPPSPGTFDITLRMSGLTPSQQVIFNQAIARWSQVIVADLPNETYSGVAVDDLLIDASAVFIDGVGGILGQAGPDSFRTGSLLPYHGIMQFDTADLAALEASGGLYYTVLHEIGHVLGIGTLWSARDLLLGAGTANPIFTGASAVAVYNSIFGTTASGVPVENTGGPGTRDGHWRESIFDNELMTGYLNSGVNPMSRVTIASLGDLGYTVNMAAGDDFFSLSSFAAPSSSSSSTPAVVADEWPRSRPNRSSVADPLDALAGGITVEGNEFAAGRRRSGGGDFDVIWV